VGWEPNNFVTWVDSASLTPSCCVRVAHLGGGGGDGGGGGLGGGLGGLGGGLGGGGEGGDGGGGGYHATCAL
jgi:hypothetical protein